MNRQLELKDIAGYLPYGLKVEHTDYDYSDKVEKKVGTLIYMSKDCIGFDNASDYYLNIEDIDYYNPAIKPILRPMSDLYKTCLEGGKIPIVELAKITGNLFIDYKVAGEYIEGIFTCGVKFYDDVDENYYVFGWDNVNGFGLHNRDYNEILFVPNQLLLFQKLYEWHFDVNNLIGQDLAIDINKVKI